MDSQEEALQEPVHEEASPRPAPVMDVVPPPATAASSEPETEPKPAPDTKTEVPGPKPVDPPKQPRSGVTAAIVATVIIVLGLAGLAVFAYLQAPK